MSALFIFSSIVLILDIVVLAHLTLTFKFFVGCMLLLMGGAIIKRTDKKRIHLHMNNHSDGTTHQQFHSHAKDSVEHPSTPHKYTHNSFPFERYWLEWCTVWQAQQH
jgi:hypothetical protein